MKKTLSFLSLLFFFSCSTPPVNQGMIVLNYKRQDAFRTCSAKLSSQNNILLKQHYGSISESTADKVFSTLGCDHAKLSRFLKATQYLADLAELGTLEKPEDFIVYFIPKICLAKLNYDDELEDVAPIFEQGYLNKETHELFSCSNEKYKKIVEIINKDKNQPITQLGKL